MARVKTRRAMRTGDTPPLQTNQQMTIGDHVRAAGAVPSVLLGAVDGVGLVAGGLLQLTRNVLVSAVSGAADIGAEALNATVTGARGVVTVTSRMVGDMAGTARSTWEDTVARARQSSGRGPARADARRPPVAMAARSAASTEPAAPTVVAASQPRRSARRPRAAA